MANTRLEKLVKELGKYYGVKDNLVLVGENGPERTIDVSSIADLDSNADEFLRHLLAKSKSAPLTSAIYERAKDFNTRNLPLLITPDEIPELYDQVDLINVLSVTNSSDKITLQGERGEDKSRYTTAEIFPSPSGNAKAPRVSVIQCFTPAVSSATSDTDITSLFMRNAPSFNMSQAVPYLDVSIASAVSTVPNSDQIEFNNYTLLGRFLGKVQNEVNERDLNFYNADFDPKKSQPRFDPIDELQRTGRTLTIIGGMESFTSPQTMVNANHTYNSTKGAVLDQFQPFMSLLSLKLSVTGQGGLMAYKNGTLELILHDRARLNDIGSLIAPDRFGNTRMIITYGWCHPSGRDFERNGYKENSDDLTGALIDSMRITEVFLVINSKFSFEQSSVKISLAISEIGSKVLTDMDVSVAVAPELQSDITNLKQEIQALMDLLDSKNSERQSTRLKTITVPSFIRNPDQITVNHTKLLNSIKDLRKAMGTNNGDLTSSLSNLFGSADNEKSLTESPTFKIVKRFGEEIERMMKELKDLPDPFLPVTDGNERNKPDKSKHVSLGKILTYFLGNAFNKRFGDNVELQLFFHPFNHDAARMNDYNISQFYFEWDDLIKVLKDQYSPFGFMSFGKLFNILQQYFVNDLAGPAYDFLDDAERGKYARNPENMTARGKTTGKKTSRKFETKEYEESLEKNKSKRLKMAYYGSESDPRTATFRMPQLNLNIESFPARAKWEESASLEAVPTGQPDTVVRIHVLDRCCEGNYTVSNVLKSAPGRVLAKTYRKSRNSPYSSNHYKYAQGPLKLLEENGFLKSMSSYLNPGGDAGMQTKLNDLLKQLPTEKQEEIKRVLSENYYIFNAPPASVKNMIKSIHPSMDYGTLATGIFRASVSSIDDSGLATIMLIRGGKGAKGSEGEETTQGVPMSVMPVSVSIETFGCPYFSFAQFYFIDFGTNTNVDNVYAVTGIDHTVEQGKFITSVKLTWSDSFAIFKPLEDSMREAALKTILQKLNVLRS
jgi:hypothetical protein